MDTVPYTFHSHRETGTVDAVQPVPGLFVYQLPEHLRHPYYPWLLGHTSGKCIAAFEQYGHAMEAADVIADELIAAVDAYALCDRIECFTAGLFISAKPLDVEQAA